LPASPPPRTAFSMRTVSVMAKPLRLVGSRPLFHLNWTGIARWPQVDAGNDLMTAILSPTAGS